MIKVLDVKYVVYGVSDIATTKAFMVDFGLIPVDWSDSNHVAYFRGALASPYIYVAESSSEPALKAIGIEVESVADLERAAQIEGASAIQALRRPGGGRYVEVTIPGGIKLELVHGMEPTAKLPIESPLIINEGIRKSRFNTPQRPDRRPAQVLRLGHVALGVPDPVACKDWVIRNLGMIVSDAMLVPGTKDDFIGFFMRWDRGEVPSDHHSLLIAKADPANVHHISFELQDIDSVYMGHEWLKSKAHRPHWGVGRHVLGSQVFDYWWDPDGFRVEHYADGDLYNKSVPATTVEGTADQLWTWGPEVPETFFQQTRNVGV
jgi:catechol 2,3-dioxygenase-like lactoylglutathione lyase family enzyme